MKLPLFLMSLVLLTSSTIFYLLFKDNKLHPKTDRELSEVSVMVTRLDGLSGGSGVILKSGVDGSEILTNGHVCAVVQNGGRVIGDRKSGVVYSYTLSNDHDLCLIKTKTNFNINTKVADNPPYVFSEAAVVGHPALLPTAVTRGHFSHFVYINIMTGIRPCTEAELNSELGLLCLMAGGIPIIKHYEAQFITSTIMPGSSGSPVFTENGEIGGLVFAGSQGLSYGIIVPNEYVRNFLQKEMPVLMPLYPNNTIDITKNSSNNSKVTEKLTKICEKLDTPQAVREICNSLENSVNYL